MEGGKRGRGEKDASVRPRGEKRGRKQAPSVGPKTGMLLKTEKSFDNYASNLGSFFMNLGIPKKHFWRDALKKKIISSSKLQRKKFGTPVKCVG